MAKKRRNEASDPANDDNGIPFSPLLDTVRPKPDQAPTCVVLTGYPGPAKNSDTRFRLYQGLDFQSYYELEVGDVVKYWSTNPDDENAPINVAIESTAQLDLTVSPVFGSVAAFLQGDIVFGNLAQAVLSQAKRRPEHNCSAPPTCVGTSARGCT